MFVGGALGDEHAAIPFDECTDHGNGAAFGHPVSSGVFRRTWQGQSSAMADRLRRGVGAASGVACASNRAERERVLHCDDVTCYSTVLFELQELLQYINPESPAGKIIARRYDELWKARESLRSGEGVRHDHR